jgi:hypothetical protein
MPRQVDYHFSLSSPWAHIGHEVADVLGSPVYVLNGGDFGARTVSNCWRMR